MTSPETAATAGHHPHDLDFHPMSYCDATGSRLFRYGGELFRGVPDPAAGVYRRLFDTGAVQALTEQGLLVESQISQATVGDWPLLLRHRTVPVVSYPCEWCAPMLRDAAQLVADLAVAVAGMGMAFTDASGWNVLFEGCRPVYVDFTSIEVTRWSGWERELEHAFRSYFLEPLRLMAHGYGDLARYLLADYDQDIARQFAKLMNYRSADLLSEQSGGQPPATPRELLRRSRGAARSVVARASGRERSVALARALGRELARVPIPAEPIAPNASSHPERDRWIAELLDELKPGSVTDLGAGEGFLSFTAARRGIRVIAIDANERRVSAIHRRAVAESLPLLPLVMNLRNPTPGSGVLNRVVTPAFERLRSDMVIAVGIVDELAVDQFLPLDRIAETIRRFTTRWAVIDARHRPDATPAYSADGVRDALGEVFPRVTAIPGMPGRGSVYLAEV